MEDFIIDGISLDPENKEFKYALDSVQYTNHLIYLTGKAGTGKTTFLKYLRKVTSKKMVVLAPTGVAAVNTKGQTIHSFFHIPISLFVPEDKRLNNDFFKTFRYNKDKIQIIKNMELLVIDEVSMVRSDLLDVIDVILRKIRKKNSIPFGGVQVLLIGDTFQLPPVVTQSEWSVLKDFYDSTFFFSARVMSLVTPLYIELKKVYRQKEKEFIDLLNRIRVGKHDDSDIQLLNTRFVTTSIYLNAENYITLTTTKAVADAENKKKLETLPGESVFFEAQITGDFPVSNYPTNRILELKKGTQVMFIKNDTDKGFFNGKIGKVVKFDGDGIIVDILNEQNEKISINVEPMTWENVLYSWNDDEKSILEKVTGSFKQYPLRLAWAITVHKSQGMTFEKVIADVGNSFASGQVYVALSRCTSLNGLILKSRITRQAIKTDPRVIAFAENEVPETLILENIQKGKADFYYKEARKCIIKFDADGCYDNFVKAIKYRNDIETSLFRRFVCIWIKRFEKTRDKIQDLEKDISTLVEEKEVLKNENLELMGTTQKQNNEINKLLLSLSEKEEENKEKEEEIITLNRSIKKLMDEKESLNSTILSSKEKEKQLREIINRIQLEKMAKEREKSDLEKELDRVRKIKWYQKLFGKE